MNKILYVASTMVPNTYSHQEQLLKSTMILSELLLL